ncbi:hypothetical protein AVEN_55860-1 [Araneus ventricosus]|uniref:Uncharacterized protein n=1 Tax=Araneus ventricosus TaxID=182803 RepID=A0A4Y2GV00_ARAVE|nr:hypothetical protein AVEN_55860-1 [Araneus ventricosus]
MTRTTPGLASPLQASAPYQWEGAWLLRMIYCAAGPIHFPISSVESGFEHATRRPRGRGLTTRPPRPHYSRDLIEVLLNSRRLE